MSTLANYRYNSAAVCATVPQMQADSRFKKAYDALFEVLRHAYLFHCEGLPSEDCGNPEMMDVIIDATNINNWRALVAAA